MPIPQTPSAFGGGRGKLSKSSKHRNISREILQNSVFGSTQRLDMLQMNNVELARKVTELKQEMNLQAIELQAERAESFNLRMKLNSLQSRSSISSVCLF